MSAKVLYFMDIKDLNTFAEEIEDEWQEERYYTIDPENCWYEDEIRMEFFMDKIEASFLTLREKQYVQGILCN